MTIKTEKYGWLHRWRSNITATDKTIMFNSVWLGLGEGISKGALFLATVLLIRYLSPSDFGYFSLANSLAVTTGMVIDFGLSTIVTRDLSGNLNKAPEYLSNVLSLKLILGGFYLVLIIAIAFYPEFNQHDQWLLLLILLAFFIWFQDLTGLLAALFIAEEKMEKLFYVQVVHYCGIALAALHTVYFHWSLKELAAAYVLASALGTTTAYLFFIKENVRLSLRLDRNFLSTLVRRSLPLFGAIALITAYTNADTLMIGHMLGTEAVGFYQGAYKFLFVFQSVNLLNTAIFPRLSICVKSGDSQAFSRLNMIVILFCLFMLLPATLIAVLYIKPVLIFIYGEKMIPSITPLRYMISSASIYFLRNYLANILIAQDRQRYMFVAIFTGLVFNIILNMNLIPVYGFAAGGFVLLLSEIVMCAVLLFFIIKAPVKSRERLEILQ